jgi:uncharacterized OB-fold protein
MFSGMDIPRHWRMKEQRYALVGTVCSNCGKTFFTPRPICDACHEPVVADYAFGSRRARRDVAQSLEPSHK